MIYCIPRNTHKHMHACQHNYVMDLCCLKSRFWVTFITRKVILIGGTGLLLLMSFILLKNYVISIINQCRYVSSRSLRIYSSFWSHLFTSVYLYPPVHTYSWDGSHYTESERLPMGQKREGKTDEDDRGYSKVDNKKEKVGWWCKDGIEKVEC